LVLLSRLWCPAGLACCADFSPSSLAGAALPEIEESECAALVRREEGREEKKEKEEKEDRATGCFFAGL